MFRKPGLPHGLQGKVLKDRVRAGEGELCDQPGDILLTGGEVIQSQQRQHSSSSWSGVYVPVGSIPLTSSARGFSICRQLKGYGYKFYL